MNTSGKYAHWRIEQDEQGLLKLVLDKADATANVLSRDVMEELYQCLEELEGLRPTGVLLVSGKDKGFVAGADISEFTGIQTAAEAEQLVLQGQAVINRLEDLPCATVAVINGFALGGGLELAMACDYRVMTDDPKAVLGLPEVKLGLHPGFGGTVRAVRLAGVAEGMQMMLTGRNIRPAKALKLGLVDGIAPSGELQKKARDLCLSRPPRRSTGLRDRLLSLGPVRSFVARAMTRQVARQARKEHYPAPYAMIELWQRFAGSGDKRRYEEEARSFARLMVGDTARNLVRVFFLQDRLKGQGGRQGPRVERVHVVGAGVMGGDIAAWCALRGLQVTLQDREMKYIEPAMERARQLFERKTYTPAALDGALSRLQADPDAEGVARADLIIEAIFEDAEAKKALYREIEPRMKPGALLATNTSSIRLEILCEGLAAPDRLIGLHFFNPVAMMPLVEVIHTPDTQQGAVDIGLGFARQIDRLPLPCLSAPGFLVNRVLGPYMMEAMLLAEEGMPLVAIDALATGFGMPMGPVELIDSVGLDVASHVGKILGDAFGLPVPGKLAELVDQGHLGRKTGRGFYAYQDGKPVKEPAAGYRAPDDTVDRLILPMVNQVVACLGEGVIADADLADAGVIFGTGFAPFTGGPVNYARHRGVDDVVAALGRLEERYGPRFKADPGWQSIGDT